MSCYGLPLHAALAASGTPCARCVGPGGNDGGQAFASYCMEATPGMIMRFSRHMQRMDRAECGRMHLVLHVSNILPPSADRLLHHGHGRGRIPSGCLPQGVWPRSRQGFLLRLGQNCL